MKAHFILPALLGVMGLVFNATAVLADSESTATTQQKNLLMKKWGRPGPVYDLAVRSSGKGRYGDARILLLAVKRPDHPLVLNQLGYATRKLGKAETAIPYYEKALKIDPGFMQARHYLGEAWLQLDKPELARKQLAALDALCGRTCAVYLKLDQAIIAHSAGDSSPAKSW